MVMTDMQSPRRVGGGVLHLLSGRNMVVKDQITILSSQFELVVQKF
jgi:hypothetical protein